MSAPKKPRGSRPQGTTSKDFSTGSSVSSNSPSFLKRRGEEPFTEKNGRRTRATTQSPQPIPAPDHPQDTVSDAPIVLSPKPIQGWLDSPKPLAQSSESSKLRWDLLRRHVLQNQNRESPIAHSPSPTERASPQLSPSRSTSKLRWDILRRHVLHNQNPESPISHSPSPTGRGSPQPSSSTHGRPPTPKPSRFPRLGLRQVVENARDVVADDMRKFVEELEKACAEARFVDLVKPSKKERESSQNTVGSYLSLPSSVMGSTPTLLTNSLPKQMSRQSSAFRPSVVGLLRALERYEFSPIHRPQTLPLESQVLSTLLMPFLSPGIVDAERELAFRAFMIVVTIWRGDTNEAELNRCLWCCRAASASTKHRAEVLGTLSTLLFSRDTVFRTDSPVIFQTLLQGLFSLYPQLTFNPGDLETIRTLISEILSGGTGLLLRDAIEREFDSSYSSDDSEQHIREALATESVARCIANGSIPSRSWILRNLLEEFWPLPPPKLPLSLLFMRVQSRKINAFVHATLQLLMSGDPALTKKDIDVIIRIVETRILPEIIFFGTTDGGETKSLVVRLLLQVLCNEAQTVGTSEAASIIKRWLYDMSNWRAEVEKSLSLLIEVDEIHVIVNTFNALKRCLSGDVQKTVFAFCFPKLAERLLSQSFSIPDPALQKLLQSIAGAFPQLFFKPLFACAASKKDSSTVRQLSILISLSNQFPHLWTFDAEMMAVALMGMSVTKAPGEAIDKPIWDQARLGSTVILLELVGYLQGIRRKRERSTSPFNPQLHLKSESAPQDSIGSSEDYMITFATSLESKLAVLLSSKERYSLVPFSQRILFCALFFEIRLITRSLKPVNWLSRVVTWLTQWHNSHSATNHPIDEVTSTMTKLRALYSTALAGYQPHHKHKNSVMFGLNADSPPKDSDIGPALLTERIGLISSFSSCIESSVLPLLVAVSGLLSTDHYLTLAPILWDRCLDNSDTKILLPACFLIMQGAEKCPTEFTQYIQNDLTSHEPIRRRTAIHRISILLSRRVQILSQIVILDRSYRRPFKSTRHVISFIPTDIGSNQYVKEEHSDEIKDKSGKTLPLELRKRLQEVGWEDDDKPVDQRLEWAKTPMSLLPSTELAKVGGEEVDSLAAGAFHAIFEKQKSELQDSSITRRRSFADTTAKRRPVFVSSLISFFPRIASHVFDPDFSIASTARNLLLDLMRDDPAILSRTVFNAITGSENELASAISTLRTFLHVRQVLPPAAAHHIFTHLTGYLKFVARQVETVDALQGFAYTVPILAKLVSQVSNMSIRDIRRAKIEVYVIPTLSLWFPPSAPAGPMFPRSTGEAQQKSPFEISSELTWIAMIRTSQNMLFYSMLRKNPQDVHIIRKNLTKFVLPYDDPDEGPLNLADFVPQDLPVRKFAGGQTTSALSIILSRSYLLLVAQIFRSMSRHTNDPNDLAILVKGINRILLAHGNDIGIVGQAMIALMAASTRFRRFFTSAGGYTLFMPAVFKVYTEASERSPVRLAVEYATNRFYALHQEAFVFQTLDVITLVILKPDTMDMTRTTNALYSLLSTLKSAIPTTAPDPAGIHNANKGQEREAIIVSTVEEKPQSLFDHIRRVGRNEVALDVPEEYEGKRFALDDIVRVFLTVVAHNPTVVRAERFLHVLRYLTPDLYHASNSARTVLTGGVVALGPIFLTKAGGKTKLFETTENQPGADMKFESFGADQTTSEDGFLVNSNLSVDLLTMRMEYLELVLAFTRAGGLLNDSSMSQVMDLVKAILKESRPPWSRISSFLGEYTKATLMRSPALSTKQIFAFLVDLASVVLAHYMKLNFSEILTAVSLMARNPLYATDPKFPRILTNYCNAGLAACELAASTGSLFSSPMRSVVVDLMNSCVPLRGMDLVSQLEKRRISYDFLVGVVFPFALALKPMAQAVAEVEHNATADMYARTWIRLLGYVISACQLPGTRQNINKSASPVYGERKSTEKRGHATDLIPVSTLAICLQIVKVIVIKAGDDLTSILPDVWPRISAFFAYVVADGDASFAIYPVQVSQPSSPAQSPKTSISGDPERRFLYPPVKRTYRLRTVDYLLWSLFELLCLHRTRTSLLVHMRLLMQEKVGLLEEQLRSGNNSLPTTPSTRYSRRVSATFSKRGRTSRNASSSASSPNNLPNLQPRASTSSDRFSVNSTPTKPGREAGYLWSSPGGRSSPSAPRIVHLGPVRHSSFLRDFESREKGSLRLLNSTVVKSAGLVRATFRRVRVVQSFLGYSMLLSYPDGDPGNGSDEDVADVSGWTKAEALQSVVDETQQLMDEFSRRDDDLQFEETGDNTAPEQSASIMHN